MKNQMQTNTVRLLVTSIGCLMIAVAFCFMSTPSAQAKPNATITVNTTADEYGTGAGCSLREAIKSANSNSDFGGCVASGGYGDDVISLPAGTYTLTISGSGEDLDATGDLDIRSNLTINGAGSGLTIIDGNASDRVFHVGPVSLVVATLSGLKITNGKGNGGGINVANGYLTIDNVLISGNDATCSGASGDGGGISNAGVITIANSTITNNCAQSSGGGVYNTDGAVTIISSTISLNSANGSSGGGIFNTGSTTLTLTNTNILTNTADQYGGGIYQDNGTASLSGVTIRSNGIFWSAGCGGGMSITGTVTIINSTIYTNSSPFRGGGICSGGWLTITSSTILDNHAADQGGGIYSSGTTFLAITTVGNNHGPTWGGGLYVPAGTLTLINSNVRDNTAIYYGGGIWGYGMLIASGSTVMTNFAGRQGGGIWLDPTGILTFTNSTLSGNSANWDGGGLYTVAGSTVNLNNATITNNTASSAGGGHLGGGIYAEVGSAIYLKNTILAGNTGGSKPDCSGTLSTQGFNLLGANGGCTGLVNGMSGDIVGTNASPVNPLLGPLANNGGATWTHLLLPGSRAINTGNPTTPGSSSFACPATDQRGATRPIGGRCDMGAVEVGYLFLPLILK